MSFRIEEGDIFLISQGESHTVYSDPSAEACAVELDHVLHSQSHSSENSTESSIVKESAKTNIVCGHFIFNKGASCSFTNSLPTVLHRKNGHDSFGAWLHKTLNLCSDNDSIHLQYSDVVVIKTAEIALTLAIRMCLDSNDDIHRALFKRGINNH